MNALDVDGILILNALNVRSPVVIVNIVYGLSEDDGCGSNITSLAFELFLVTRDDALLKLSCALSLLCVPSFNCAVDRTPLLREEMNGDDEI